jgi:MFS transporter, YNFM family, putative membrane transport protein
MMEKGTQIPDVAGVAEKALREVVEKIEYGTTAFLHASLALLAAGFATVSLLYCVQPLMPLFVADFAVSAVDASLTLSLTTGLLAVSMLAAGALSEVCGRKPLMVASLLLSSVLTMVCAMVPHWHTLLVVRALTGVALSGLPAVAMAYVAEEMHPRSLGLAMGLYVGGAGLGGMAGRLLTGIVTDNWGWRAAMTVIGSLGFVCAAILWRNLPASRHFVRRDPRMTPLIQGFGAHFRDPVLRSLFAVGFLVMGSFVAVYNYISYRLLAPPFSLSQAGIGEILAVYLGGIVSSTSMGRLSEWLGRNAVLPATLILMLAGMALTLSGRLSLIVVGIAMLTFGYFGSHSVASAWVAARARTSKEQASSLYLFAYYLGSSVMGWLGGVFWKLDSWRAVISLASALVLAAIAIALHLRDLPAHRPDGDVQRGEH